MSITIDLVPIQKEVNKMKRCIACRESYDDQFISNYETLDHQKSTIQVCEFCWEEHAEFDDEKNIQYIHFGQDFYPNELI